MTGLLLLLKNHKNSKNHKRNLKKVVVNILLPLNKIGCCSFFPFFSILRSSFLLFRRFPFLLLLLLLLLLFRRSASEPLPTFISLSRFCCSLLCRRCARRIALREHLATFMPPWLPMLLLRRCGGRGPLICTQPLDSI